MHCRLAPHVPTDEKGANEEMLKLAIHISTLVLEGRVSDVRVKEGPHCNLTNPLRLDQQQTHQCDLENNVLCVRNHEVVNGIKDMWPRCASAGITLELRLYAESTKMHTVESSLADVSTINIAYSKSYYVLEQWIIKTDKSEEMRDGPEVNLSKYSLIQSVLSQIHFSQLRAWWSKTGGASPNKLSFHLLTAEDTRFHECLREHTLPPYFVGLRKLQVILRNHPRMNDPSHYNCTKFPADESPLLADYFETENDEKADSIKASPADNEITKLEVTEITAETQMAKKTSKRHSLSSKKNHTVRRVKSTRSAVKDVKENIDIGTHDENNLTNNTRSNSRSQQLVVKIDGKEKMLPISVDRSREIQFQVSKMAAQRRLNNITQVVKKHRGSPLLGSFEESIFKGRFSYPDCSTTDEYEATVMVHHRNPSHLKNNVIVDNLLFDNEDALYTKLVHILLDAEPLTLTREGNVQISLFKQNGHLIRIFPIDFDLDEKFDNKEDYIYMRHRVYILPKHETGFPSKWMAYVVALKFERTKKGGCFFLDNHAKIILMARAEHLEAQREKFPELYDVRVNTSNSIQYFPNEAGKLDS